MLEPAHSDSWHNGDPMEGTIDIVSQLTLTVDIMVTPWRVLLTYNQGVTMHDNLTHFNPSETLPPQPPSLFVTSWLIPQVWCLQVPNFGASVASGTHSYVRMCVALSERHNAALCSCVSGMFGRARVSLSPTPTYLWQGLLLCLCEAHLAVGTVTQTYFVVGRPETPCSNLLGCVYNHTVPELNVGRAEIVPI